MKKEERAMARFMRKAKRAVPLRVSAPLCPI